MDNSTGALQELERARRKSKKRHDIGNTAAKKESSEKTAQTDAIIKERNTEINKRRQDTYSKEESGRKNEGRREKIAE